MPPGKIPAAVNTPWQRRLPPVRPWVTSCGRIEAGSPPETRLQAAQRSFTPFLGLRPGLYCRVHCNTRFPPASMPRKQGRAMGVGAFPDICFAPCPVENCTVPRTALPMLLSRLCGRHAFTNASAGDGACRSRRFVSAPSAFVPLACPTLAAARRQTTLQKHGGKTSPPWRRASRRCLRLQKEKAWKMGQAQ